MFKPTKAHEKEIKKGQYKIRMGGRVPKGAVNLAYSYVTPLTPDENVQIADTSGFILENVASEGDTRIDLRPDDTYLLRDSAGKADVYSQSFLLTNVYKDDEPLYFSHRLMHLHYDVTGPDDYGRYRGKSIVVVDRNGERIGDKEKKVRVMLQETAMPGLYNVDIYTNFQSMPTEEYKVIYNAVYFDGAARSVMTGHGERINPQPAFHHKDYIEDVTNPDHEGDTVYYKADSADFGYSRIYASKKPIRDKRTPVTFRYRIRCDVDELGTIKTLYSAWIGAHVLNAESLTEEDDEYTNGFKRLADISAEEIMKKYLEGTGQESWLDLYECEYSIETTVDTVEAAVKPDGNEPPVARTDVETGSLILPLYAQMSIDELEVEFQLRVALVHKQTGTRHVALVTNPYRMKTSDGLRDLKNLYYAEWSYPEDYEPMLYEALVEVVSPTAPVTFSLWDNKISSYTPNPVPCEFFDAATDIVIRTEVDQQRKVFTPRYSLRPTDSAQVRVLRPVAKGPHDNWHLRIKNGRFYRSYIDHNNVPQGYGYFVPEYYLQSFDEEYGLPYRQVRKESPQVVDTKQIKLLYTPLFIEVDRLTNKPANIKVLVNKMPIEVRSWDAAAGVVELEGAVRESDNIEVDYFYHETCYEYRGFYDEKKKRFWYLDLNPGKGHFSTQYDKTAQEIKDLPSFGLINQTVYMYMKPAGDMTNITQILAENVNYNSFGEYTMAHQGLRIFEPRIYLRYANTNVKHISEALEGETAWEIIDEGYVYQKLKIHNPVFHIDDHYAVDYSFIGDQYRFINGTFQKSVLFHTFEEITNQPNTILLGKIQVRPNSARDSIKLTDTRSRGGGLLESIGQNIINEISPEANSYWDIGYWDGNPYPENGVILIKLPRHILREYGGKLTKEEVETSVEKHLAFGVFYIVEYLEEPTALMEVPKDLVVEIVDILDPLMIDLPKPTFTLITEG